MREKSTSPKLVDRFNPDIALENIDARIAADKWLTQFRTHICKVLTDNSLPDIDDIIAYSILDKESWYRVPQIYFKLKYNDIFYEFEIDPKNGRIDTASNYLINSFKEEIDFEWYMGKILALLSRFTVTISSEESVYWAFRLGLIYEETWMRFSSNNYKLSEMRANGRATRTKAKERWQARVRTLITRTPELRGMDAGEAAREIVRHLQNYGVSRGERSVRNFIVREGLLG